MPLLFGTAGIPLSTRLRDSISGIKEVRALNLDCMELEFVRSVHMSEALAGEVKKAALENSVALSVHAPYYINLNSKEKEKLKASKERIIQSALIGSTAGARNIVFHAAYYGKDMKKAVYKRVKEAFEEVLGVLKEKKLNVVLRPETTGKATQFGELDELAELSRELGEENVLPCIDFSHLHARTQRYNSYAEFREILGKIEKSLGKKAIKDMHIHFSGIEYTRKGERRHLNLDESDLNYPELLKALKEYGAEGLVISESPNIEGDAILIKREYAKL